MCSLDPSRVHDSCTGPLTFDCRHHGRSEVIGPASKQKESWVGIGWLLLMWRCCVVPLYLHNMVSLHRPDEHIKVEDKLETKAFFMNLLQKLHLSCNVMFKVREIHSLLTHHVSGQRLLELSARSSVHGSWEMCSVCRRAPPFVLLLLS